MISKDEAFLYADKQGTPEEGRRIQQLKLCEKNNKDEDNSLKPLTDKKKKKLSIILITFPAAEARTVNINWNVTASRQPVRQVQYVVYLRNNMIGQ